MKTDVYCLNWSIYTQSWCEKWILDAPNFHSIDETLKLKGPSFCCELLESIQSQAHFFGLLVFGLLVTISRTVYFYHFVHSTLTSTDFSPL